MDSTLYYPHVMESLLQKRRVGKRILPLAGILLVGVLASHAIVPHLNILALSSAPEPATYALIGGALCLVSLRLRRRK